MKTQLACIALVASLFFVSCDKDDSFDELQQEEIDQKTAIDVSKIKKGDI